MLNPSRNADLMNETLMEYHRCKQNGDSTTLAEIEYTLAKPTVREKCFQDLLGHLKKRGKSLDDYKWVRELFLGFGKSYNDEKFKKEFYILLCWPWLVPADSSSLSISDYFNQLGK